ncbi:MAG: helix-turn-helix transcriptional regulator [Clostridia bacterium]|nr:helix-turn-helix transcriptional regulator [Clostridia bacterium]
MKKDTSALLHELQSSGDFKKYYSENSGFFVKESLSELLERYLSEKGESRAEVIRRSGMSVNYAYQIFNGTRVPERNKLLCLCVAMGLTLEETQTLLKACGYSQLYVKIPFDCVVIYGILHKKSVIEINCMLYDYGLETIG